MFQLAAKDIHLNQVARNKSEAIQNIANALVSAEYVASGYGEGMLQREQQAATYLGNGIAIPHGTTTTRHLVKKTGVQVFHFPEGVKWGDEEQLAYVAIGIAASSDEHLTLLRQLTHVLSDDNVEERLKNIQSADDVIAILTGKTTPENSELQLDNSLLLLDIPADSLATLQALNASRLLRISAVNSQFVAAALEHKPTYLGQGVWLNDSIQGNVKNAIAISRPSDRLSENELPVKLLITASAIDDSINDVISKLANCLFTQQTEKLLQADATQLITLLKPESSLLSDSPVDAPSNGLSREFIVVNPHGLHTRPSSMLIKLIKGFNSAITIENLDGTAKAVNATSLMKVVALGAKKGNRLRFTAVGDDAKQALDAIGKLVAEGFGEGAE